MPMPRKTDHEHWLAGSKPAYSPDGEESQFKGGRPKMPKDLGPIAQAEWRRVVKELSRRGTLTRVDSSALELYVVMYERWRLVDADVKKNGAVLETTWLDKADNVHVKRVENPACKIVTRLENSLRAYQKEFGLTPASRERTKPAKIERKPEHNEEFINIL